MPYPTNFYTTMNLNPNSTAKVSHAPQSLTTTINGGTTSAVIPLGGYFAYGLQIPSGFSGTVLKFMSSIDNGITYQTIINSDGTDYSVVVSAGKNVPLDPNKFFGWQYLKIVSNATETAQNIVIALAPRS